MDLKNMTKDDLELLSNKDITNLILEDSKKSMSTAELFKEIIRLLELPSSIFENKIADYYTSLTTDKRFVLLEDGTWDLRSHHTSDKIAKVTDEEDEEESEEKENEEDEDEELSEDSYDDIDESDYDDETNEELKDLVIIDEDELELEQ